MTEEKAHDINKDDPEYQIKVSDVIKRRLEQEKQKVEEAQRVKMSGNLKSESQPAVKHDVKPAPAGSVQDKPADNRDPEEVVRRKDIIALVSQLNKSFAIIEKNRLKTEKFITGMRALLNELEKE